MRAWWNRTSSRLRSKRRRSDAPVVAPYWRLEFRAIIAAVLLVGVMVGAAAWSVIRLTNSRLLQSTSWACMELGEDVADRLSPALAAGSRESLRSVMKSLRLHDRRLAFLVVQDVQGTELAVRQWDGAVYLQFENLYSTHSVPSRPASLSSPERPEAQVIRQPVFATLPAKSPGGASRSRLVGYVIVGASDPIIRGTMQSMQATALGVVCLVTLASIPATILLMRRITRPLRRITEATAILASGRRPPPLPVARPDEIGVLARNFNEMAQRLDEAREELLQINEALEQQVMRRTAELHGANDALAREISTKNEFLRTVSHDLGAPLRNIAGMIELIRAQTPADVPDSIRHRLDRISANVDMQSSMLADLLELSRIRTRPDTCEDVDLAGLAAQVIQTLEADLLTHEIRCDCETALPVVHLEYSIARQVFLNLLDNAIKYMGASAVRRISIAHTEHDGELRISVTDSGPGIPAAERDKVFQVFRRGSTAVAAAVPGRGVGLAGVRMAVERWGGRILLESNADPGQPEGTWSRFIVCIPSQRVVRQPETGESLSVPVTHVASTPAGDHSKEYSP